MVYRTNNNQNRYHRLRELLTEEERSTLINACYVANERFRECRDEFAALAKASPSTSPQRENWSRTAAQFQRQIIETDDLLALLQD